MRRTTLGTLNIGNQPRQIREKKTSLGARPSTGGRLSTSGRPSSVRRSSQYGSYSSQVVKDPRSLSDRGYHQKMIRYLMEFLTEFSYPHPISNRVLSSPPMKEFKRIFIFIYKYINNNSKDHQAIEKKPEEEVPKILKMLGYPFSISKSSMFSVGSPHTWPNLLGSLCWLIELIRFSVTLCDTSDNVLFPEDGCDQEGFDKSFFNYLEKTYTAFLKGRDLDDLEDFDNDFFTEIRSKNGTRYKEMEQLESDNSEMEEELARLQGQSRLQEVMQQKKSLVADEEKFRKYITDLKKHKKKMAESNTQLDEDIRAIRMEVEAITKENMQLQDQLNRQELSPADVERLKMDKQGLVKILQTLEKHQIDQQIWDREMQYAKIHEGTEKNINEYNETARKLKLIPVTAVNARGVDFEMRLNPMNKQPDLAMHSNFKGTIKNALVQLRQQIAEKSREIQSQIITEDDTLDQVTDMVESRLEESTALEAKLTAFDKELEWNKEVMNKEYTKVTEELHNQENKVLNIKQQVQAGAEKKDEELKDVKTRAEARLNAMEQEKDEYDEFLTKACGMVMDHKTAIQNRIIDISHLTEKQLQCS